MSTPHEQDEAFVMLPDLALGTLPAAEAERLMAIVMTSPRLQAELSSLRGTVTALGSAAPVAPLAAERKLAMRDRLLARASGGEAGSSAAPGAAPSLRIEPSETRRASRSTTEPPVNRAPHTAPRTALRTAPRLTQLLALAASAAFVVSLWKANALRQERDDARVALKAATVSASQLTERLASRDSLVMAMSGPGVTVYEMASAQVRQRGARMFFDQLTNRWTLITHHLDAAPTGRTYQLWLVTKNAQKISAGTFNTDPTGRAVVQATYALAAADLGAIAITEEPTGGSPQPTGDILIVGTPPR
jgi:anti-sigma-K factor RskA